MACIQRTENEQASGKMEGVGNVVERAEAIPAKPKEARYQRKLPTERKAITHKFVIGGHEGYITVGMYEDGSPGEIFLTMSKEGTVVSGLTAQFAHSISTSLQYGVPLEVLVNKFTNTRYEPSGITKHPQIRFAKSITDYVFRWLAIKFLDNKTIPDEKVMLAEPIEAAASKVAPTEKPKIRKIVEPSNSDKVGFVVQLDAPPCQSCGSIMIRSGACYKCANCGSTSGCS